MSGDLRERLAAALYLRNAGNTKDDEAILHAILPIIESELEAELATARRQIEHAIGIPQEELWRKLNDGTGRKLYFQEDVDALFATVRREAYLRCAQHITSGDDRVWALKNIAATYRKWAEEADGGGK